MIRREEVVSLSVDAPDPPPSGEDPDLRLGETNHGLTQEVGSLYLFPGAGRLADRDHVVAREDLILEGFLQFADRFDGVHPDTDAEVLPSITAGIDGEVLHDFVEDLGARLGGNHQEVDLCLDEDQTAALERGRVLALPNVLE